LFISLLQEQYLAAVGGDTRQMLLELLRPPLHFSST
jgi:hypothetical protein